MKTFRPVEIVACDICGQEFDKLFAYEMFTGRTKYICPKCHERGHRQIDAKHEEWRASARGKTAIEYCKKNR